MAIFLALTAGVYASNVVPDTVSLNNTNTFGVYQVGHTIVVYSEPDENSTIKQKIVWGDENVVPQDIKLADMFILYLKNKDLALMAVTDETDDWVEVIYDSKTGAKGWIKKDDPYKFNTWVNFYNMYGRKYGLMYLKGTPESSKSLYGSPDDEDSKAISSVTLAKAIKLTNVSGNWLLAIIYDVDHSQKIGWLKWRTKEGQIYLFPAIK